MSLSMIRHMDIKLSYACNNNCVHCVVSDQREGALKTRGKDFRTTEEILTEVDSAASRGFDVVTFTGGEPTLRKDLPLLARRARERGLAVGIQTNGRVLSYAPAREDLLGMEIRFVVAVHGPHGEIHDRVTRVPGSFEQTISAIQALTEAGEKVTGKVVLSYLNYTTQAQILRVLADAGVRRVNFTFPHGLGNAGKDFTGVVPRYSEVMPHLHDALEVARSLDVEMITEAIPLCLLGTAADRASEDLYRRHFLSEVRQLDQGPRDWSSDRVHEGKAKPESCGNCRLNPRCEGVWKEYLEAYGGEELVPVHR